MGPRSYQFDKKWYIQQNNWQILLIVHEFNFYPVENSSEEMTLTGLLEPKRKEQAEKRIEWPVSTGWICHYVKCEKPGSTSHSKNAMTQLDLWKLFLSDKIIHEIVHLDKKITAVRNKLSNEIMQDDK